MGGSFHFGQALAAYSDDVFQPQSRDVLLRPPHRTNVCVIAADLNLSVMRASTGFCLTLDGRPLSGIVAEPAGKAIGLSQEPGRLVQCHQRPLQ